MIVLLVSLPLLLAALSLTRLHVEHLRAASVACALGLLALTLWLAASPDSDPLSSWLLPMAGALWLLAVAVTPSSRLDRNGLRRTALAAAITVATFSTREPISLALAWAASSAVFWRSLDPVTHSRARRVAAVHLAGSTAVLIAGVAFLTASATDSLGERLGLALVLVAALVRKGIFPFHTWLPEVFDTGRLGPAVQFSAPQVGTYVALVLVVPRVSPAVLAVAATLALITTTYGAALALYQRDARRACGYLFVSQSALVMAGLECTSPVALAGALVLWISSAIAFSGIARCVLLLEARRGRLDLNEYHGGYQDMPLLAVSFLVLGLACTGFPGTLGFIGGELLVDGTTAARPILGFTIVLAGAFTGLSVLRMYFSLFCGRRDHFAALHIRRREGIAFAGIAAFLIGTGILPGPVVASRLHASDAVIAQRLR